MFSISKASKLVRKLPFGDKIVDIVRRLVSDPGAYLPGHFHSTIPRKKEVHELAGITMPIEYDVKLNDEKQLCLLKEFALCNDDYPVREIAQKNNSRFYFNNYYFEHTDAIVLSCMLQKFKPGRIIEIGSGFSSALMLEVVDQCPSLNPEITFIEPDTKRLDKLLCQNDKENNMIISKKLQEVNPEIFNKLDRNDILFIDSSHVAKFNSDVLHIFFKILPKLKRGVIVHFHDIFIDFEYPKHWLLKGWYWNESYLLRAFLSFNTEWEIMFFSDYINKRYPDKVISLIPDFRFNHGCSIYIRRN